MDAGHVEIDSKPVNLSELIEEWLDDLGALPDSPDVKIEKSFPPELYVAGEKRYTSLIVQNVLENARKYNRPGGRMRVTAKSEAGEVVLLIGNTGRPIARTAQKYFLTGFTVVELPLMFRDTGSVLNLVGVGPIARRRFEIGVLGRRLDRV